MPSRRPPRARPALDEAALERLALHYAGRYATSRAKLAAYLHRKLSERGWAGVGEAGSEVSGEPPVAAIVERFAELGYVDDRALAEAKARASGARGYGERRLAATLSGLGIAEDDSRDARSEAKKTAWATALRFAERRRIGPFATDACDEAARRRAFGAMMRAGHSVDHARRIVNATPGDIPVQDDE